MKRRSFLGNLVASAIALVVAPKVVKAEEKKDLYRQYPLTPDEAFPISKNEDKSYFLIENGFITLYTTREIHSGDFIKTDVFFDTLYVKDVMIVGESSIVFHKLAKLGSFICTLSTLKYPKRICKMPVITMINGKLKAFKKKHDLIEGKFVVAFRGWKESSK